jgi:hypothetical protein
MTEREKILAQAVLLTYLITIDVPRSSGDGSYVLCECRHCGNRWVQGQWEECRETHRPSCPVTVALAIKET